MKVSLTAKYSEKISDRGFNIFIIVPSDAVSASHLARAVQVRQVSCQVTFEFCGIL